MAWRIEFDPIADKELDKLDAQTALRIVKIPVRTPRSVRRPTQHRRGPQGRQTGELWKYRVGDYRVIADVQDEVICILVLRIGNRRGIYRR